jgi:heterodisulfide reductase subunit C
MIGSRRRTQPEAALDLSIRHDPDLITYIEHATGENIRNCYQCGKCAAGCPLSAAMDLQPQQILRALQLGQTDLIFSSDTLWLCVSCQTCVTRCPCEVDLPRVMDALRAWAVVHHHAAAQREIVAFQRTFLKSIELTGRVYEIGLIGGYNLTSGHLFSSFDLAAPMVLKGKIKPIPQRVKAMDEVAGIFRRARELREREAQPQRAEEEKGGGH